MIRRILLITLAGLFTLVVGGILAFNAWLKDYLASDAFRKVLSTATSSALRVEGSFEPLKWSGWSVYSESFVGTGHAGSPMETLTLRRIRTECNWRALLKGVYDVEEITIGSAQLVLDTGKAAKKDPAAVAVESPTPSPFKGRQVSIGRIVVDDAGISWTNGTDHLVIEDSRADIRKDGGGWLVRLEKGTVRWNQLPSAQLETAVLRIREDSVFLQSAQLRIKGQGEVQISGEISHGDSQFTILWNRIPIREILSGEWKQRLDGLFSGTAKITTANGVTRSSGTLELTDGLLEGLPVQAKVAAFTGQPQFRRMPIQTATCNFEAAEGNWTFSNIAAESRGLTRCEGKISISREKHLEGDLKLGVTRQSLQWLPGSREKVFTVERNGYLWTDVRLTGTTSNPHEDLSARLTRAMGEQVIDTGVRAIEHPVDTTREILDTGLEVLRPLLP